MDVLEQSVRVNFRFPVCFTTGLFNPANVLLRTVTAVPGDPRPADAVVVHEERDEREQEGQLVLCLEWDVSFSHGRPPFFPAGLARHREVLVGS